MVLRVAAGWWLLHKVNYVYAARCGGATMQAEISARRVCVCVNSIIISHPISECMCGAIKDTWRCVAVDVCVCGVCAIQSTLRI